MRLILTLLAIAAVLIGAVWILQGFNLFPGRSFMNGDRKWALYGACIALGGLVLLGFARRLAARGDR
jgi:hypothetical protein